MTAALQITVGGTLPNLPKDRPLPHTVRAAAVDGAGTSGYAVVEFHAAPPVGSARYWVYWLESDRHLPSDTGEFATLDAALTLFREQVEFMR